MRRILHTFFIIGASTILFSSFLSSPTFAVSDLVFTNPSSVSNPCGSSNCYLNGFRYLIIDSSSHFYNTSPRATVGIQVGGQSGSRYYYPDTLPVIISLRSDLLITRISSPTGDVDFIFTFSDNLSSFCPSAPSGSITLAENGTFDVSSYASAIVDVPPVYGDYHDDLISINNSILICGAVILVLYFFYTIYRMIIKSTGGWS